MGVCPGNNESAGKRKSGRTTKGDRWLRGVLLQCAWAATPSKGTALQALSKRLVGRRGRKRALVAVAHRLLGVVFNVLKKGPVYQEPAPSRKGPRMRPGEREGESVASDECLRRRHGLQVRLCRPSGRRTFGSGDRPLPPAPPLR